MKTLHFLATGAVCLMASGVALAQGGHMMNGGFWDGARVDRMQRAT